MHCDKTVEMVQMPVFMLTHCKPAWHAYNTSAMLSILSKQERLYCLWLMGHTLCIYIENWSVTQHIHVIHYVNSGGSRVWRKGGSCVLSVRIVHRSGTIIVVHNYTSDVRAIKLILHHELYILPTIIQSVLYEHVTTHKISSMSTYMQELSHETLKTTHSNDIRLKGAIVRVLTSKIATSAA